MGMANPKKHDVAMNQRNRSKVRQPSLCFLVACSLPLVTAPAASGRHAATRKWRLQAHPNHLQRLQRRMVVHYKKVRGSAISSALGTSSSHFAVFLSIVHDLKYSLFAEGTDIFLMNVCDTVCRLSRFL